MTARPLCVASLAVLLCMLLLTVAGVLPLQDTPPEEVADILDTGQQVWLEGVVDSRERERKFDTVYYKECAS